MSVVAYSNAEPRRPARWHSMTHEVRMGTMCEGKREMLRATRQSRRAAVMWSLILMSGLTSTYECNSMRLCASSCGTRIRAPESSLYVSKSIWCATRLLGYTVRLAHQKINQLVRQRIGACAADHFDRWVERALAALQEEAEGLREVAEERPKLACLQVVVPGLVVLRHFLILIGSAVTAERRGEGVHLFVLRGHIEGVLRPFCEKEELDGCARVPGTHAVLGDEQGALRRLRGAHEREGLLRLVEVVKQQPYHRVGVVRFFVRGRRLGIRAVSFLGLCVLGV
eukprot:scaffold4757_cov28-Tisochrysis_lutea.AAC.1